MHIKSRTLRPWLVATCGATALIVAGFFLLARGRQAPSASEGSPGLASGKSPPTPEGKRPDPAIIPSAPVAQRALQILKVHCYRCHGQDGEAEGGMDYILDVTTLVGRRTVVPGKPDESKLYRRLIHPRRPMPPKTEKVRPSQEEIASLKRWIESLDAGASAPQREFLTDAAVIRSIGDDLQTVDERSRRFIRYFTLTHLRNAGRSEEELQTYRQGLSKLINSLSWGRDIANPKPIDRGKMILRIDLRDYEWDRRTWEAVVAGYPYGVTHATEAAKRVYAATGSPLPHVRADWFVFAASRPPLYHDVLGIPATVGELEKRLEIDPDRNIRQERVARAGFNGSGVSRNNRLIERHRSRFGAYWKSYDFAGNKERRNLFEHPLGPGGADGFHADGGEIIFSLPNGLQGYMLTGGEGERLSKAPVAVVSTRDRRNPEVVNGISCMECHAAGMIFKDDQVRKAVEGSGAFSRDIQETVKALYPPKAVFDALLADDAARFKTAVELTGDRVQKADTVVLLSRRFEEELDLTLAAAEVGMKPEEFATGLKRSERLGRALAPLLVGGTVQRDTFLEVFASVVQDLRLGVLLHPSTRPSPPNLDGDKTVHFEGETIRVVLRWSKLNQPASSFARVVDALAGSDITPPLKHDSYVLCRSFSPDGRRVVTGSRDMTAQVWDAQTGKPVTPPLRHDDWVNGAVFSPDGRRVVTHSRHAARVWNAQTGKLVTSSLEHKYPVMSALFSPDGRRVVTASRDGTARVWNAETGEPVTPPLRHDDIVSHASFSPDARSVVTAGYDKTARIWDAQTGRAITPPLKHDDAVWRASFSPDGRRVVTASADKTARVWDAQTGRAITPPLKHDDIVWGVSFSPDGDRVVTASADKTARVWDAQSGRAITPGLKHEDTSRVAFSPDGSRVVTASPKTARVWDAKSGKHLGEVELREP